jgi:diacylglycerol kinase (ATP)
MRVAVIHNPSAGAVRYGPQELLAAIRRAGHETVYRSTRTKGWRTALESPGSFDLVVAAGGDGTVDKVGVAMAGRGVPMAILPLGTANNIARALGLSSDVEALIAAWRSGTPRPFDVGLVHGVAGERRFLESVGVGLFPDMIVAKKRRRIVDEARPSLMRDLERMIETSAVEPSRYWHVKLDDLDLSGEHLAVEAMNIGDVGPTVCLAPQADPADGLMDVVTVPASKRDELTQHLIHRLRGQHLPLHLPVARGRQLVLHGDASALHVDGRLVREPAIRSRTLTLHIGLWPHALEILV